MRILGIDPGTAIVGWGVIDQKDSGSHLQAVAYGCITTDKSVNDGLRLVAIANGMRALLSDFKPDIVAVERLFFANNQKTVMTVSQARGVILYTIAEAGIEMAEYTPLQVKQGLTGYGKAEKIQVQTMVKQVLRMDHIPKPDDAADALAIAITAMHGQSWQARIKP